MGIGLEKITSRRELQFAARRKSTLGRRDALPELHVTESPLIFANLAPRQSSPPAPPPAPPPPSPLEADEIVLAYRVIFGATPSPEGLQFWRHRWGAAEGLGAFLDDMAAHRDLPDTEFLAPYPVFEAVAAKIAMFDRRAPIGVINAAFARHLGRRPTYEEARSLFMALAAHKLGPADIVVSIAQQVRPGLGAAGRRAAVLKILSAAARRLSGGRVNPFAFKSDAILRDAFMLDAVKRNVRVADDIRTIRERLVHPVAKSL